VLESLIKTLLLGVVIVLFAMVCYKSINDSAANEALARQHAILINVIDNLSVPSDICRQGFNVTAVDLESGEYWNCDQSTTNEFVVSKPLLINGHAGRVYAAS
jgi:hypothetical protein